MSMIGPVQSRRHEGSPVRMTRQQINTILRVSVGKERKHGFAFPCTGLPVQARGYVTYVFYFFKDTYFSVRKQG